MAALRDMLEPRARERAEAAHDAPRRRAGAWDRRDRLRLLLAGVLALAGALPFALVHVDDIDAATYTVIARHLTQGDALMAPRYLPDLFPAFREHPPLFLWVQAAVIRLFSEGALPWLGLACGVATVLTAFTVGRRLAGGRAALLGAFVLASTEQFFRYQARARLDPPLVLCYTASVALLLAARGRTRWLLAGGLAAGLGALVKGPPALGAPVSAALALVALGRARELRSGRTWLLVAAGALAPAALFFGYDAAALGGSWWRGYVQGQVLASATGARLDGNPSHLGPLRYVAGGFWPGLPFALFALWQAARGRPAARARWGLLAWAAVVLGAFSAVGRTYWWYVVPAYVPLALLAGSGADELVGRLGRRARAVEPALAALGAAALVAAPLWPARWLVRPCAFGPLPARAAALAPPGAALLLAPAPGRSPGDRLAAMDLLAAHSGRDVLLVPGAGDAARAAGAARVALVEGDAPAGWSAVAVHGAYTLAQRR